MTDYCSVCGAMIEPIPVEGTPPEESLEEWEEVYECKRGHKGRLIVKEPTENNGWQREERTTGALSSGGFTHEA